MSAGVGFYARSMEVYIEHNSTFSLRHLSEHTESQGFEIYEMQRGKVKTLDKEFGTLTFSIDLSKQKNHQTILEDLYGLEGIEYVKEIA